MNEALNVASSAAAATATLLMALLGCVLAGTVVARSWRSHRGQPGRQARQAAERRAEGLLSQMLGPHGYMALLEQGYLDLPSQHEPSGRWTYRIAYPPDGVLLLEDGAPREHLCILPTRWVPAADVFLTHKALLEGDEDGYLRLAVHTPLDPDMLVPQQRALS